VNCFQHPGVVAVGLCKNCHRGLCPECAAPAPNGLACRGRCEAEVEALDQIVQRSKTAYAKAAGLYQRGAYVLAVFGFACVGYGVLSPGPNTFFLVIGAVMFAAAVFQYRSGQRYAADNDIPAPRVPGPQGP